MNKTNILNTKQKLSKKKGQELVEEAKPLDYINEGPTLLNKKTLNNAKLPGDSDDDSSDEELVVRTGNVTRIW